MCQNKASRARKRHSPRIRLCYSYWVKATCPVSSIHIRRKGWKEKGKNSSWSCHLVEEGKKQAVTTCKLKNLHSCLVLTSPGTAACGAVALSWPARSTWPAPPAIGRATVRRETRHRKEDGERFSTWTRKNRRNAGSELDLTSGFHIVLCRQKVPRHISLTFVVTYRVLA